MEELSKEQRAKELISQRSARTVGTFKSFKSSRTMETSVSAPTDTRYNGLMTKSEILSMSLHLESMKKSNAQLRHEQEKKYSITVDTVEALRDDIHRAKTENSRLLAEIEVGKQEFDRLQHEMEQLKSRFVTCQKELRSFRKERNVWDDTKELLDYTEGRCRKLSKINQELRATLLKHHINPDINAKKVELTNRHARKIASPSRQKRAINAVSIRQKLSPQKISWN